MTFFLVWRGYEHNCAPLTFSLDWRGYEHNCAPLTFNLVWRGYEHNCKEKLMLKKTHYILSEKLFKEN